MPSSAVLPLVVTASVGPALLGLQVEDRPVVKERVTRIREHHPVEKEFVVGGWPASCWQACRDVGHVARHGPALSGGSSSKV